MISEQTAIAAAGMRVRMRCAEPNVGIQRSPEAIRCNDRLDGTLVLPEHTYVLSTEGSQAIWMNLLKAVGNRLEVLRD